ncbi:MAG: porin family protein [Phocaeicola sp.]|nr:porin family protein [Phocaeicola sp.]
MKRFFSALMVMALLLITIPANAQLKFGVKGGLNISKVSVSKDILKSDNQTGFFIGPMAEFTVPVVGLGFDVAALYNQSGVAVSDVDGEANSTLKTVEIPINVKWTFGLGSTAGIYVAAGPQFGFNVGNRIIQDLYEFKKNNTTFNVGAGVKLIRHLQIGVNYNFGLSRVASIIGNDEFKEFAGEKIRNNTWQISLAYLF